MKKVIKSIPILMTVSVLFLYSCDNEDDQMPNKSYTDVMAEMLKMDLVNDASISPYGAIFDVSPAYDEGHLPFATNAGGVEGLGNMLAGLDKNLTYLVYCHGDGPSIAGAELMAENGFTNVHRLQGNYGAWDNISFVDISAEEVNAKIKAGEIDAIFDVSPVWEDGHLPGAINANPAAGGTALEDLIAGMDNSKSYLVYCHGDAPAMAGAQLMEDAEFKNVYRLEGNYGAWVDAGYDVETSTPQKSYTDVMASQLKSDLVDDANLSPYAAIFDVSPAYDQGHVPFATNSGSVSGLENMLAGLDKNLNYLVYCHGDGPSIQGAELMAENGFKNVHRLEGNYGAWDEISFVDIAANTVKSKVDATDFEAIFDVSPHYSKGHIIGAKNANSNGGGTNLADLITGMDKNKSYLVYCHGNGPAMAGAQLMEDAGFKNVYRLEGNYGAWDEISFVDIDAAEVKAKIDANEFESIFDVSPSYNNGHLPGATNANSNGGGTDLADLITNLDKTKSYLVYCHGNGPAIAGAQLMEDAGFKNVFRLEGNYGAWVDAGYTVDK